MMFFGKVKVKYLKKTIKKVMVDWLKIKDLMHM
jgi:hypothetical protein